MKRSQLLSIAAITSIAVLVTCGDLPSRSRLWVEIQNACHAPAFGLLAFACLVLLRTLNARFSKHTFLPYLIAFSLATGIGLLTELVQHFTNRDAEIADLFRDTLGIVSFLGFSLARDPAFLRRAGKSSNRYRLWLRVSATGVLLAAFTSLGVCVFAYIQRDRAFPTLIDLTAAWSRQFIQLDHARLSTLPFPAEWTSAGHSSVAFLVLESAEYPELTVEEPVPDWTAYNVLRLDLYSPGSDTVLMGLRVDDIHHDYSSTDRFTVSLKISPGHNSVSIDLARIRTAPIGRETDMCAIRRIILFAREPKSPIELYVNRVWLD